MRMHLLLLVLSNLLLSACGTIYSTMVYYEPADRGDTLTIREGILSKSAQRIKYQRNGKYLGEIILSEPILVARAEQEEEWGYFQFPCIAKANDGTLVVSWQMRSDSHVAYGKYSNRETTPMISKDGGRTWLPQERNYHAISKGYNVLMNDGTLLEVCTPSSKDINTYKDFPKVAVAKSGNRDFYKVNSLPDDFKGVYLQYTDKHNNRKFIHAKLKDSELLRYSVDGVMPVVWWGGIKQISDNTLISGVYPARYLMEDCKTISSGVSFYKSTDRGVSWSVIGKILFNPDGIAEITGEGEYTEPDYEILADNTFICVMRSGSASPMYKSFSYDNGYTWSTPQPFTPNGVKPRILLLKNGTLVLASGRPGIQLRFSFEGNGNDWTDPIDMIPFVKDDDTSIRDISCGYASIIEANDNSFYLVYSDFTTKNENGDTRKCIWFRKVSASRK